jgi:quinol monooxygenase YgiN
MFIRVFRAKVQPGKQAEFKKCLELLTLPNIQYRNGMVAFYPGQPAGTNSDEFVLITVWRDSAAARKHSKSDWARMIIPPEALPLVETFDIQGYQAFGVSDTVPAPLFGSI